MTVEQLERAQDLRMRAQALRDDLVELKAIMLEGDLPIHFTIGSAPHFFQIDFAVYGKRNVRL